jgi:hypothetical protein
LGEQVVDWRIILKRVLQKENVDVDCTLVAQEGTVVGSREHNNEHSISITGAIFLDKLRDN